MSGDSFYARWAKAAAIGGVLVATAVLLMLFFYAEPVADDFCHAVQPQGGHLDSIRHAYFTRTGRWASVGAEDLLMSGVDLTRWYAPLLVAVALVCFGGLYFLVRVIFGAQISNRFAILPASFLFLLFWARMPSPGDTIFMLTGSVEYGLNLPLAFLLFWVLARRISWQIRLLPACMLTLFISGKHELMAVVLCLTLAAGAAILFRLRHPDRYDWALLAVVAGAGFLFLFLAPGNAVRGSQFSLGRNLPRALWLATRQAATALPGWIFDLNLLSATALLLLDPRTRDWSPKWLSWPVAWRWAIPSVWAAALAAGFFIPSWALGFSMPGRVLTWIYMVFLVGWFVTVLVLTRAPSVVPAMDEPSRRRIASLALLVFAAGTVCQGNTWTGMRDLALEVRPWSAAIHNRYRLMREAAQQGRSDLRVPPLPPAPRSYFDLNLSEDPMRFLNWCEATFFGLATVATVPGPAPCR